MKRESTAHRRPGRPFEAPPRGALIAAHSGWEISNRGATLAVLGTPIWLSLLALLMAIGLTASGPAIEPGSIKQLLATVTYTTLLIAALFLPSYLGAYGWYWWRSGRAGTSGIGRQFAAIPLIAAALVWCPTLLISGSNGYFDSIGLLQGYLLLAAVTLVGGYVWVGIVRLFLRLWRKV